MTKKRVKPPHFRGKVTFRPRFGLLVKTRSRAARLEEGLTYCVALNRFRSLFPGFKEPQT